ncbi:hypothetical protein Q2V75_29150, partial [Pseudomonas aeruginosa]|nr:hypothetical protein [Pseudomonas aeruginosa]
LIDGSLQKTARSVVGQKYVATSDHPYGSDGKLLNLSANETIDAPLDSKVQKDGEGNDITVYSAKLNLRAAYVKSGSVAPTAGSADGSLPFTLEYN